MESATKEEKKDNSTPKYKLRCLMSPDGIWKVEYDQSLPQIPLTIFCDLLSRKVDRVANFELLKEVTYEYCDFIKDKVIGLLFYIDPIECISTITWHDIRKNI